MLENMSVTYVVVSSNSPKTRNVFNNFSVSVLSCTYTHFVCVCVWFRLWYLLWIWLWLWTWLSLTLWMVKHCIKGNYTSILWNDNNTIKLSHFCESDSVINCEFVRDFCCDCDRACVTSLILRRRTWLWL